MKEQVLTQREYLQDDIIQDNLIRASKKVAPLWPLESFVAVNPYLGYVDKKFDKVAQELASIGGGGMTLPISFYKNKIKEGKISNADLELAISKKLRNKIDVDEFVNSLDPTKGPSGKIPLTTLTEVASQVSEQDWNRFFTSSISNWAASYYDKGQATWSAADKNTGLFASWKFEAETDLSPEIMGLKGFRNYVKSLPNNYLEAVNKALSILELSENALPVYLQCLLMRVGGWAAYAAYLDWESGLSDGLGGKVKEFLGVLICGEACLFQSLDNAHLRVKWIGAKKDLAEKSRGSKNDPQLSQLLILQEAFDLATQREIIEKFNHAGNQGKQKVDRAKAQAVFCIDVRSEVYRRNLELIDKEIETLGFAGFFAFPVNFIPLGHEEGEAQCPVLIKPGPSILEKLRDKKTHVKALKDRAIKHQVKQGWKTFKSSAVTCFGFVSPMGLSYLPKLFTDSFGITRPVPHPSDLGLKSSMKKSKSVSIEVEEHSDLIVGIPMEKRVQMAKNALSAMSLNSNFARFVLIVGHGASTVNNPHASGLDCGACGGKSGEANAKVAAAVLNDKKVREYLKTEKITIPEDTVFLACLHDTTTDDVFIFNEEDVNNDRNEELEGIKSSLKKAGKAARAERAMRMSLGGEPDKSIKERSKDWSQIRPEWGLAGCSSFIVAPRERTKNIDFGGKSFLHSYDWRVDKNFSILELIMTAPMVVTSWINLQYFASTVDNKKFGAGNKTLHNVTAGLGVLEGASGDLRVGLPFQSVHDGEKFQHEPTRLNVIIEAPIEAMNMVLEKHKSVRDLCDNDWIRLLAINDKGEVSHKYVGDLDWERISLPKN